VALPEFLLNVAFGDQQLPAEYEFVLIRQGRTLGGYRPPTIARDGWRTTPTSARTEVQFGPLDATVEFDAVAVLAAGELVDQWPVGRTTIPPGMTFRFEAIWDLQ